MPRNRKSLSVTIVKLGDSLAHTPQFAAWLGALAAWGSPLIMVPGGDAFAHCVRAAQGAMGFSDSAAHRMALNAMGQFGIALAAHSDAFTLAASRDELDSALSAGKIPVWLPEKMVLGASDVPECWEVTSDSLAAWLAWIYGARRLLPIKASDVAASRSARELAADKIVDPLFPRFAAQSRAEVWLASGIFSWSRAHIATRRNAQHQGRGDGSLRRLSAPPALMPVTSQ
jgi:5-(aminomethyl)-3-furanmethanol phosphate kinase